MPSKASPKGKSSAGQRRKAAQPLQKRMAPGNALQARMGYRAATQYMQAMMETHTAASTQPVQVQAQSPSPQTEPQKDIQAKKALSPDTSPAQGVQAKLTMGQPGDKYEQEADRAAALVVADKPVQALAKVPATGLPQTLDLQRQEDAEVQMEAADKSLQATPAGSRRQSERSRSQSDANLEKRLQTPQGGRPLSPQTQQTMGEKFNSDFSRVRVHDNGQAKADAASLGAIAFTKGSDIWLGAQTSENDQELMGHELAHVVQQNAAVQKAPIQKTPDEKTSVQATSADKTPLQMQEETEESSGILGKVADFFREVPGYHLLSVIIGRDPISGESVDRNATNVIRGVIGLIPGGNQLYQYLNQTGAMERAGAWLSEQITQLGLTWAYIKNLFSTAWDELAWYDLALPWRAFKKVKNVFAEPIGRLLSFAKSVGGKIMEFVLEGALSLAGAAGKTVMSMLRSAGDVFMNIVRDPIGFLGNLLTSVKQGFGQFSANIWTHLKTGLMGWLFGALAGSGLQLPNKFGLKGILSIVLQVLGITWAAIRKRIVKVIGEERMVKVEKTVSFVTDLITRGPIAAWEMITNAIGNLKEMVLGAIQNWVVTKVVKSAVTKLVSMFNPAGAIIQAAMAIYNVVMFFVERAQQIASLFKAVTGSIGKIAAGAVSAAASFIELAMARTIPVIISFLARLLGLGGIGETIKGIIKKVQKPISKGIDKVVNWVVKKASGLLGKGKKGHANRANKDSKDSSVGEAIPFTAGKEQHTLLFKTRNKDAQLVMRSREVVVLDYLQSALVQQAASKDKALGQNVKKAINLAKHADTEGDRVLGLYHQNKNSQAESLDKKVTKQEQQLALLLADILKNVGTEGNTIFEVLGTNINNLSEAPEGYELYDWLVMVLDTRYKEIKRARGRGGKGSEQEYPRVHVAENRSVEAGTGPMQGDWERIAAYRKAISSLSPEKKTGDGSPELLGNPETLVSGLLSRAKSKPEYATGVRSQMERMIEVIKSGTAVTGIEVSLGKRRHIDYTVREKVGGKELHLGVEYKHWTGKLSKERRKELADRLQKQLTAYVAQASNQSLNGLKLEWRGFDKLDSKSQAVFLDIIDDAQDQAKSRALTFNELIKL